jgi:hypothetical protein
MKLPSLIIAEEPSEKGVLIPIPAGFKVPENKKDGEEFEILVKAHKVGDQLQLKSADGFEFASEPEPEMETEEPEQAEETVEEESGEEETEGADEASDEAAEETFRETGGEEEDEGEGLMASIRKFREGKMRMTK